MSTPEERREALEAAMRLQDPITNPEYARDWLRSTLWSFQGNWFLPISDEDDAETANRIIGDRADWILGRLRGIR